MKSSFRVVAGFAFVLALLLGLSALTVSAQGPTATPAATSVPGVSPTPAQAPPAAAAGANLDNPGIAATLGSAVSAVPAKTAQWFRFDYVTPVNEFPRNTVTVRMLNGVTNGLGFEVWSPERMQGNWWDNKPVGRGTQEVLPNCTVTVEGEEPRKCTTNDLTWVGGFAVSAPYYVRVVNDTDKALAPQIIVSGNGLAQCQSVTPSQVQAQPPAPGTDQGFTEIACPTASGTLVPVTAGAVASPAPTQAPAGAATPAASPTTAATSTPAATTAPAGAATPAGAPTLAATAAPTTAATAAATSMSAATATSAATLAATSAATATSATGATPAAGATGGAGGATLTGLAVAQDATLGPILTDSQRRTLYAFTQDTSSTSTCTGSCAQTWPPALASGTPQLGTGLTSVMVGTSARSDGGTQVTYNGHPLYYFSGDKSPGDTNGQGVAGKWFTVSPAGTLIQAGGAGGTTTPGAAGTTAPSGTATP